MPYRRQPIDLVAKIRARGEKWASPLLVGNATSVADWERDQLSMLEHLRQWAAGEPEALAARAAAVVDHLAAVERTLPDPPGITMRDRAAIQTAASMTTRRLGGGPRLDSDAEIAWWKRAELSAAVRTTLGRIPPPVAMNLLIHGYYLAMANLHVLLDWPLLKDLDSARLEAMFAGIAAPSSVTAQQDDRLQTARARLQNRPLRATYSALVFVPIQVDIRELGEFLRKTAVVVIAAEPVRTPELLGLWLVPAPSRDRYRSNLMEARAEEMAMLDDFWHELVADLARRGVQRIPVFCRDLPPAHRFRNSNFRGFDEAVTEAFPGAMIVPRINGITDAVVTQLFPKKELISDISGVARAPGADEACIRLEQLDQRWNQEYPDVPERLREAWEPLMRFVALPEITRKSILDADDDLETAQRSIDESLRARGAFSGDLTAISFLQQSLQRYDGRARHESKRHHFRRFNVTKNNRKR